MTIKFYKSIKFQMSCSIVLLTTTLLTVFGFYNYYLTKERMLDELKNFSEITTMRLSNHLVLPVWTMNKKQIEESIIAEMMEKRIHGIVIKTGNPKKILQSKKRDDQGSVVENQEEIVGDYIKQSIELKKKLKVLGSVEVFVTTKFMKEALKHSTILLVTQVVMLDFMIFLVLSLLINSKIVNNIKTLTAVADEMSMGEYANKQLEFTGVYEGFARKLLDAFGRENEFGLLAEAIEGMRTSFEKKLRKDS